MADPICPRCNEAVKPAHVKDFVEREGGVECWHNQCRYEHQQEARANRVAELEAALRPFADAYRFIQPMGAMRREYEASMTCTGKFTVQDLARAAELVPERTP